MKRIKKVLKWMGILAVTTIALLLLFNAWYVWRTGTRLERQLAALRAADEPIQFSELTREPIPPEENGALVLRRTAADLNSMQKELIAWFPKQGYPTGKLTADELEKVGKLFEAYPQVLPLIEQAAACPDYDSQRDYTLPLAQFLESSMEDMSQTRVVYRVLRARTAWLLAHDRREEAFLTTINMLRLARHLRHEPLIIQYLLALAGDGYAMEGVNRVLRSGPVSAENRQALDKELALHDTLDGYRWALRSERASALSALRDLPGYDSWFLRGFANDGTSELLSLVDGYLADADRPYKDLANAKKVASSPPPRSWNMYKAVVLLLKPALDVTREPAEVNRAYGRSLRVLNALQMNDTPGDKLPDLAALGLPAEATTDPYSGQPLMVKNTAEGWTVYSVGQNLTDDGGKLDGLADVGVSPK